MKYTGKLSGSFGVQKYDAVTMNVWKMGVRDSIIRFDEDCNPITKGLAM